MADDLKVNSNTDILEFKRKFNLFVSNYDKGEFDGDFEITGDLKVDGDVEIVGELKGADSQIASAVSTYISEHPFAPEMLTGQDISPDDISATGKITGSEIVENMSGYSFSAGVAPSNFATELKYVGVVKNGNKVTFCIVGIISRSDTPGASYHTLGTFTIPSDIASKLVPSTSDWLECKQIYAGATYNTGMNLPVLVTKATNNRLLFNIYNISSLTVDTDYFIRFEVTFLLSENLVSQE